MKKQLDPFVRAEKALGTFRSAVAELDRAAEDHHAIADEAHAQATELSAVASKNRSAAEFATRRAAKIAEFLA